MRLDPKTFSLSTAFAVVLVSAFLGDGYVLAQASKDIVLTEASVEEAKNAEASEDLEVIDLNEPVDDQTEKWDSAKGRHQQAVPVVIENIVEPTGEYRYASFGKPNPFMPPQSRIADAAPVDGAVYDMIPATPDLNAVSTSPDVATPVAAGNVALAGDRAHEIPVVSALQKYPLGQLELKGVWQLDNGNKRAIVMTPNKEGVIVKQDDPIAAGKVLDIRKDYLVVRQYRLREDGVREFSDENLYLGDAVRREKTYVRLVPGKDPEFTPEQLKPTTSIEDVNKSTTGKDATKVEANTLPGKPAPAGTNPAAPVNSAPNPGAVQPATNAPAPQGPLNQAIPAPFGGVVEPVAN